MKTEIFEPWCCVRCMTAIPYNYLNVFRIVSHKIKIQIYRQALYIYIPTTATTTTYIVVLLIVPQWYSSQAVKIGNIAGALVLCYCTKEENLMKKKKTKQNIIMHSFVSWFPKGVHNRLHIYFHVLRCYSSSYQTIC